MRVTAIIVAAGSGTRLGDSEPKAFVDLAGQPLLYYSLRTLREVAPVAEVIIAIPPGREPQARLAAQRAGLRVPLKLTAGGPERQESVAIALSLASPESGVVVVHDAARPFAPAALFAACIEAAARSGSAIAAIAVADTLKEAAQSVITATRPRQGLFAAQTPQAFQHELLIAAHRLSAGQPLPATDDAFLVERLGTKVEIVTGSPLNFKITTPEDLRMARALIASDRLLASQFD
ncbi:MAG TPA: 2-C-methyl-D-erythritol 4-phosphate cytidylyltransferase [Candidatus Binataceae bacterium]|jgi:2-C-methyl-D-erythritol 4-phosphate cytidylyltransferase|nr:2-C-methyl-D-erythritol 4-phosphate cytidylyltransferase [Candidatus Binataceae bacterium]